MRIAVAAFAASIALSAAARAQPSCGDPPRVDDQTLKGDLEGKAQFLSKLVGDANLKGQIETARTDIFSKYPDAGRVHSDTYLEYMFCGFVLSDAKLSAQEKFRAIQEFRQAERQPVQPALQATTHGAQSPAVINKGDTAINYGAPPASAGSPPPPATPSATPSAGSARTEGNQSPAVNSGGNVGIQYGAPAAPTPPAPGTR